MKEKRGGSGLGEVHSNGFLRHAEPGRFGQPNPGIVEGEDLVSLAEVAGKVVTC